MFECISEGSSIGLHSLKCLDDLPQNLSLQKIGSWATSSLVDTKLQSKAGKVSPTNSEVSATLDVDISSLLPTLQRLLNSNYHIGNIVCAECVDEPVIPSTDGSVPPTPPATTELTEVILDFEAVPRLKLLITHRNREIQKETCWTLSNITAGTVDQIQAVTIHRSTDRSVPSTPPASTERTEVILDFEAVPRLKLLITHRLTLTHFCKKMTKGIRQWKWLRYRCLQTKDEDISSA